MNTFGNNVGNLINRALNLTFAKLEAKVPEVKSETLSLADKKLLNEVWRQFETYIKYME